MDPIASTPIVDSHLDLAENVTIFGRDLTLTAAQIRAAEKLKSRQERAASRQSEDTPPAHDDEEPPPEQPAE